MSEEYDKLLEQYYKIEMERGRTLSNFDPNEYTKEEKATVGGFVKQVFLGALNEAALGAPRFILDKNNAHLFRPSEAKAERVGRGIGTTAGFILGAPLRIFSAATKASKIGAKAAGISRLASKGTTLATVDAAKKLKRLENVVGGAGGFAAASATRFPEKDETLGDKLIDIPISAALGATFGIAEEALIPIIKKSTKSVKSFLDGRIPKEKIKGLGDQFTKDFNQLDASIRKKIANLQNNNKYKEANILINKAYTGAKRTFIDGTNAIKASQATAATKDGLRKITSNDYVTKLKAELDPVIETAKKSQMFKDLGEMSRKGWHNWLVSTGSVQLWNTNKHGRRIVAGKRRIDEFAKREGGKSTKQLLRRLETLTDREKEIFQAAAEGRLGPVSKLGGNLGRVVRSWKREADKMLFELNQAGYNTQQVAQYFPRQHIDGHASKEIIDNVLKKVAKEENLKENTVKTIFKDWGSWLDGKRNESGSMVNFLKRHRGMSQKRAVALLDDISANRLSTMNKHGGLTRTFGSGELSRGSVTIPFYDRDPSRVLSRYIFAQKNRVAEGHVWGKKVKLSNGGTAIKHEAKLRDHIQGIQNEGGDARIASYLEKAFNGELGKQEAFGFITPGASQALRGAQVITKLGLASIANASQSIGTAMFTNISSTAKALTKYLVSPASRRSMQQQSLSWGATTEGALSELMQGLGSDGSFKLLGKTISPNTFLRKTGFIAIERMNRVVAAHASRDFALRMSEELIEKSVKQGTKNALKSSQARALSRMGIKPQSIIRNNGVINPEQFAKAARQTVEKTQFQTGLLDIPLWWNSPEGKLATQFKVFSFKQAQLLKTVIIDEARKGNMKPLATGLLTMPIIGEGVKDARSIVTLRKRDEKGLNRLAENMAAVGAGGIFLDILEQNNYGNTAGWLAGPTGSDLSKAVDSGIKAVRGRKTKAENFLLRNVPVAGPALMNLRRSSKPPQEKLKDVLGGIT